jgi:hypothetical protein
MPPLPPTKDIIDTVLGTALPAAAGAALVSCVFQSIGGWAAAVGTAVAVVVGLGWANAGWMLYPLEGEWGMPGRVIPWSATRDAPAWHQIPRAAAILLAVGLVSRWVGLLVARRLNERRRWGATLVLWAIRAAVVAVVAPELVPAGWAGELAWLKPALVLTMLLLWVAMDSVARDRAGSEVTGYLAAAFLAAGAVLIYHHTARFMDLALMCGCAAAGVAVSTLPTRADASGAVPLGVVGLPGLMLNGRYLVDSQVPLTSFWLVALAPLALLPFLIPAVSRLPRWVVISLRAAIVLAPLVAAVVLAAQHEQLAFEEEW